MAGHATLAEKWAGRLRLLMRRETREGGIRVKEGERKHERLSGLFTSKRFVP